MSLFGLIAPILRSPEFRNLAQALQARTHDHTLGMGLLRAARPALIAALGHALRRPVVYLTSSVEQARLATDALRAMYYTGAGVDTAYTGMLRYTEPNTAFYDTVAPVMDVLVQRSQALAVLSGDGAPNALASAAVIITSPRALMHPTISPHQFRAAVRVLRPDQTMTLEAMLEQWLRMGYENESVVERVGAFSRRGGIIDVWSPVLSLPARVELFGNQIESIRYFDPGTQRSGELIDRLVITPLENMRVSQPSSAIATPNTLLDYLGESGLLIVDDEVDLRDSWYALEAKAEREREMTAPESAPATSTEAPPHPPYVLWDEISAALQRHPGRLVLGMAEGEAPHARHALAERFSMPQHFTGQLALVMDYLRGNVSESHAFGHEASATVVLSRQAGRLAGMWSERNSALAAQDHFDELASGGLAFVNGALPEGFVFRGSAEQADDKALSAGIAPMASLVLITDAELFGYVRPEPWQYGRARKSAPERAFADWQPGDVVVHEDYGIGIYRGLVQLTVNTGTPQAPAEGEREYLLLEYRDADRLYVPLHQLDRVSRYVGSDDSRPTLNKLGTPEWTQTRQKAKGAAAQVARDMLQLYAARELAKGVAFGKDTPWQAELEASFPYVETEDQMRAIKDVKRDLEHAKPMDRLICGDVGFGKTEVALRAAFKAVQDGYQVAVLVPTTVLAQQHWNTFTRRLASYPMKVEMLSRFRTPAEKQQVLVGMKEGKVDIVIGTHGLLASHVQFANLGLLVIDEEQRFGVTAKEKLKKLRTNVHVLTLTATPIPRTLYFGLTGIRDVSRIETPPAERLPIISYVGPYEDAIVRQAIRRELDRDGQVFIVHNRINTIYMLEERLRQLAPEASFAVAHGQMEERQLSRIMNNFSDGKIDILLSTNIVESGLDIPNANTIIIDRADHFGLADLYQLRGRVGRSIMQAYAFFLYDRRSRMTEDAHLRLETLREAAGIGAGYMIAIRDLELRGAGDILGPRQSGQVASIGLDLYTRLLAREVALLRSLRDGTAPPEPEASPVTIDLPLTIGLPQSYIGDQPLRLQMYRRVASLDSESSIRAFEDELTDRFGKLPQPALNLTYQARLKLHAIRMGAQSITTEGNRFVIRADGIEKMDRNALVRLLGEDAPIGRRQVTFFRSGPPDVWKARLMQVVEELANLAHL
jgi:transcription-repair coupling factor (superfamily II helicase)